MIKKHLDIFGKELDKYGLMPWSVCWFLEFQKRGAPHFHFLLTSSIPMKALAWLWHWATDGLASVVAGTSIQGVESGAALYALKAYGAKMEQKTVPDGFRRVGRFWGVWGCRDTYLVEAATIEVRQELDDLVLMFHVKRLQENGYKVVKPSNQALVAFPPFPKGEV